jgi:hypothetical protein
MSDPAFRNWAPEWRHPVTGQPAGTPERIAAPTEEQRRRNPSWGLAHARQFDQRQFGEMPPWRRG